MARIRTVKPEFWTDPKILECSPIDRLTFIGMLNFADDNGNIEYSAKMIKALLFPVDDVDMEDILLNLWAIQLVRAYSNNGKSYLNITGFNVHQKIDRPGKPRCPLVDDSASEWRMINERSSPEGKGKEGKGKEGKKTLSLSGKKPNHQKILDYLNLKCKRQFKLTPKHRECINSRINEGYTMCQFEKVVDKMVSQWGPRGDMMEFLRPITLFGTKFDSYLNHPEGEGDETADPWEKVKRE